MTHVGRLFRFFLHFQGLHKVQDLEIENGQLRETLNLTSLEVTRLKMKEKELEQLQVSEVVGVYNLLKNILNIYCKIHLINKRVFISEFLG